MSSINPLIDFFNKVIIDIQDNNLSNQQLLFISQFYTHYTTYNQLNLKSIESKTNSKLNFSPSIYDLLTAGITFYSSLTDSLDIPINFDIEDTTNL
jgi:hypothetical protein